MKKFIRITLGLAGLGVLAMALQFGASHYGWPSPFGNDSDVSGEVALPPFVMGFTDPAFGPECGDYGTAVGSDGGYGIRTNLEYHTRHASAIVEGTARVAGPAQYGDLEPGMDRINPMEVATGIHTPFTIEVSETHKGPEKAEWAVAQSGGLVGCFSYQLPGDAARIFDGATGLFFISGSEEFDGDHVLMTIAESGPEWFRFTESNFGPIEQAVALIKTFK